MHDIRRKTLLPRWRRSLFIAFVGVLGLLLMVAGPFRSVDGEVSLIGVAVVAAEIALLIIGVGWLALLVTARRRDGRKDRPPGPRQGRDVLLS